MPDSTLSTLEKIRIKIRRIVRSPSNSQITNEQINEYINTFILYDLPASLKLNSLNKALSFYTSPNIDKYSTNTTDAEDSLYNFKNKYSSIHGPVYVSGAESSLILSEEEFRGIYPKNQYREKIGTGNGIVSDFTGTIDNVPILRDSVAFTAIDNLDNLLISEADNDGTLNGNGIGAIDYEDGDYGIVFSAPPKDGTDIYLSFYPYTSGKPDTILFKNETFTLRPVPNSSYKIEVQGFVRPTELLANSDIPELAEWWSYIVYGASRLIFQDRSDFESVANIMPELDRQETLINRRTIVQNSGKRAFTIYSDGI